VVPRLAFSTKLRRDNGARARGHCAWGVAAKTVGWQGQTGGAVGTAAATARVRSERAWCACGR
jgi:hypothetical protein